ncbi:3'-to-5' oligoribonuclease B, Bacillus type [hydrothermal vent metagenome]|uniref:3'-to-5' oligoribonuclease B, Bacillus type n=1 Tax=hydrothermal vent metagenome TaxID=652676 RepID=A0A1W1B9L5_9ZZZZ
MQRLYHLSHIDLDGYGCQYLTRECFDKVEFYNANYGPEVKARLEEIVKKIEQDKFLYGDNEEFLILITDLNLTTKEGNWIEREAVRIGAKLQLLDHHATGANAAERFAWYKLDTTRCATLITYDWLIEHYGFDSDGLYKDIVKAINAIDIWLSDDDYFEFGKVGLGLISGAREINRILFPAEDRSLKLMLIEKAREYVTKKDGNILLDDAIHSIKKEFFMADKNDTKDNLVASFVAKLLGQDRARLTIYYRGFKGILGYNVGSSSLIGNRFLLDNPDYDFYMDVNYRGNFSLRSNDKMDVSKMAAEIGNGGGHPNASGGKIENFKDSFVYNTIKNSIQEYIDNKTA